MLELRHLRAEAATSALGPWTAAGGTDPDFDEVTRTVHHALLTDPNLLTCFRRRFPEEGDADYDRMVRLLGYLWDCRNDGTVNVTGCRCAVCGRKDACGRGQRTADACQQDRLRST
jgi:hypothetical protein